MTFDLSKKYKYKTAGYEIVALDTLDGWVFGRFFSTTDKAWYGGRWKACEIVEVKPRIHIEQCANIYRRSDGTFEVASHPNRDHCDRLATKDRIACVPIIIDCEEGEGL